MSYNKFHYQWSINKNSIKKIINPDLSMPITSRQFTMVLHSHYHTHTLTMIQKNTCTKMLLDLMALLSDSLKSMTKETHIMETVGDHLWVANK